MSLRYHTNLPVTVQREHGITEPAPLAYADRVHHDDLDSLMHVNNVRYFVWFERLRIRYMEHFGIGSIGDPESPRIVIRGGEIRYLQEMLRDEDYVVTTGCSGIRTTSLSLHQAIWAGGTLRATFDCVMVLLKQDGSGRAAIPDDIRQRLLETGGAQLQS